MKISQANTGRHHTDEAKRNMSEARRGIPSPLRGRHPLEQARRRMSEGQRKFLDRYLPTHEHWNRRRHPRTEFKKGNTLWLGRHHSEATKAKLSQFFRGRSGSYLTPEVRRKMSDSHKGLIPWNKGLTKETSPSLAIVGEKRRLYWTSERRRQLSEWSRTYLKKWWEEHPEAKDKLTHMTRPTKIELMARESLEKRDIPFIVNRRIEGLCFPDIVLPDARIAIFCNGCFWHACPEHSPTVPEWLRKKIKDLQIHEALVKSGWRVLVAWEHEFKTNPDIVGQKIDELLDLGGRG